MSSNIQKIDWQVNKKRSEQTLAEFFVEHFNQNCDLNYRVVPNIKEASDIDVYAIAENCETLNLQLKTGEPEEERFWGSRRKHGSGMGIIDGNIEELLAQIIQYSEKHYANKENLTLLITERYQPVFDKDYALLISNKFRNATFKGVYLVKLAAFDTNHPYEGQIVAIKDIFGNHGKIF